VHDRLATLTEIEAALWRELTRATHDRHHEWRTVVLATVDHHDGEAVADARNLVLRDVHADAKQLVMYTDARAAKVQQLRAHPVGRIVVWSRRLGWQLRCRVRLVVDTSSPAVAARWGDLRLSPAASDYLSANSPGTPLNAAPQASSAQHHFAIVTADIEAIDWLELHREGHRRATFSPAGAQWLQP
jgi:pyridoxamine 5'-phosphate oxidase